MNDLGQYRLTEHSSGRVYGVEARLFPALEVCFFCEQPAYEGFSLVRTNFGLGAIQPFPAHTPCARDFECEMREGA